MSRGKNNMDKDEGAYKLSNIYNQLIVKWQPRSDGFALKGHWTSITSIFLYPIL